MNTKESLQWHKFPVLNDGFVCLVDVMGDDAAVVQAARVSYGEGTKKVSDDRTLIRYLMRMRHSTPFEMAEIKLLVRVPMDTWRQWIRHRTANVNEYSTRYSEAIDSQQTTPPDEWRLQSSNNKQGSGGYLEEWPEGWRVSYNDDADPEVGMECSINIHFESEGFGEHIHGLPKYCETPGGFLSYGEDNLQAHASSAYRMRLRLGVAREQARKDLPLSTYTEAYWKIDLHNMLHFLGLRMDPHAQKEIRDYATVIGEQIVKPLFPLVYEAFSDYRLGGMTLSRLDILALQRVAKGQPYADIYTNQREVQEATAKFDRMGLL